MLYTLHHSKQSTTKVQLIKISVKEWKCFIFTSFILILHLLQWKYTSTLKNSKSFQLNSNLRTHMAFPCPRHWGLFRFSCDLCYPATTNILLLCPCQVALSTYVQSLCSALCSQQLMYYPNQLIIFVKSYLCNSLKRRNTSGSLLLCCYYSKLT